MMKTITNNGLLRKLKEAGKNFLAENRLWLPGIGRFSVRIDKVRTKGKSSNEPDQDESSTNSDLELSTDSCLVFTNRAQRDPKIRECSLEPISDYGKASDVVEIGPEKQSGDEERASRLVQTETSDISLPRKDCASEGAIHGWLREIDGPPQTNSLGGDGSVPKRETLEAISRAKKTGAVAGIPFTAFDFDVRTRLTKDYKKISRCENRYTFPHCENGCKVKLDKKRRFECRSPVCPGVLQQFIHKWEDGFSMAKKNFPHGEQWETTLRDIRLDDKVLRKLSPRYHDKMFWSSVSAGLVSTGNIIADVNRTLGLRAKMWPHLRDKHGAVAGIIAVDCGLKHGHVHLHALVYSPFIERKHFATWLQSQDCTVVGCNHLPDDRCELCKHEKKACNHLDDGRTRCNGSWNFHIKSAEHLKRPIDYMLRPDAGYADEDWIEFAELRLAYYLALNRRKKIQRFGLAEEKHGLVSVNRKSNHGHSYEHDPNKCPKCGGRLITS